MAGKPHNSSVALRSFAGLHECLRRIEELLPELEELHFFGGEPLLSDDHWGILELLAKRKMFHLRLSYNTNFSVVTWKQQDAFRAWRFFKNVRVSASLDASFSRGEYIRKGQNWQRTMENRRRMLRECPHVQFMIVPVLSIFNAFALPEFHREWLEADLIKPGDMEIQPLVDPPYYNVQILPAPLKWRILDAYQKHIDQVLLPLGERGIADRNLFYRAMKFVVSSSFSGKSGNALLEEFRETVSRLDRIRGDDFKQTFPEYASLFQ